MEARRGKPEGGRGFCVYLFFCDDSGISEIIFSTATFTLSGKRTNVLKKGALAPEYFLCRQNQT
jgi:hypothetical protein